MIPGNEALEHKKTKKQRELNQKMLHQNIKLLRNNTAKFTQEGKINLEIIIDKNHLKFVVTDTGCGIPISNHEKVFKKFEKINEQDS